MCINTIMMWPCRHAIEQRTYCDEAPELVIDGVKLRVFETCRETSTIDTVPRAKTPCPKGWRCCHCSSRCCVRDTLDSQCSNEACSHTRCDACQRLNPCRCRGDYGPCSRYALQPKRMCRHCAKGVCGHRSQQLDRILEATKARLGGLEE